MSEVKERFLKYISLDTTSRDEARSYPSSPGQLELAQLLKQELLSLGLADAQVDAYGYVTATVPENVEGAPVLALIAHMDTSNAVSGADIKPRTVLYEGGDLCLNEERQIWMRENEYPELADYVGQHLIVTDGTTLLGSDDKAGVAEIMSAVDVWMCHPEIRHGRIRICFTPDEEVGEGTKYLNVDKLGADFGYTVDGGALGEFEYENFNAASADIHIHGISMHPGASKGRMVNAILIGMKLQDMLPVDQRPEYTEGYEGFFHLQNIEGDVENCRLQYIIRDHDKKKFAEKKERLEKIAAYLNEVYGEGTVELTLTDCYYNMKEKIEEYPILVDHALRAYEKTGITPRILPIRGGTDGARLSYEGLPCPNLSTGGHNFHSVLEFVPEESLEKMVAVLVNLAGLFVS